VPGGAYVEGAIAQEENMFRRTDCHFHIGPDEFDAAQDRYLPKLTRLLSANDGLVYLDTREARVCIRGPEDRSLPDLGYHRFGDTFSQPIPPAIEGRSRNPLPSGKRRRFPSRWLGSSQAALANPNTHQDR
jgi:hypothetical protein